MELTKLTFALWLIMLHCIEIENVKKTFPKTTKNVRAITNKKAIGKVGGQQHTKQNRQRFESPKKSNKKFHPQAHMFKSTDTDQCDVYKYILTTYGVANTKRKTNCCNLLGCLSNEETSQFNRWPAAPWCLESIKPEFHLFTADNGNVDQVIDVFKISESVRNVKINKNKELYAIIHGWNTEWVPNKWMFKMKDALIAKGNNVIIVRWSEGSNLKNYFQSAANTVSVGMVLGLVITKMVEQGKADLSSTTIVGFSLGAHAAGFAGKNLTGKVKRVIGLDPAGPMYACEDPATRLSNSDAKLVQIIHTNGDSIFRLARGTMEKLGHIDFYANGGMIQPGCEAGIERSREDLLHLDNAIKDTSCSHGRAPLLFTEMISKADSKNKCFFKAFPCDTSKDWQSGLCFKCSNEGCPVPGPQTDIGTLFSGTFYFGTLSDSAKEFCGRQYLVTLTSDNDASGEISLSLKGPLGESNVVQFQGKNDTLESGVSKAKIAVTSWEINKIDQLLLTYKTSKNILRKNGAKPFILNKVIVESTEGNRVSSCSPFKVNSDEQKAIDLHCT